MLPFAHGELPLWIRNNGAGRPLWGQGQTFLFDPLHWLTLLAADPSRGWDLKFVAHRLVFAREVVGRRGEYQREELHVLAEGRFD